MCIRDSAGPGRRAPSQAWRAPARPGARAPCWSICDWAKALSMGAGFAPSDRFRQLALAQPGVALLLEPEREVLVAALHDAALVQHVHPVGHDVVEQALVVRDDHE